MFSEVPSSPRNRRLSIIDVSSADDSLLDANPSNTENPDLLCTPNSRKFEDAATKLQQWDHESHSNGKPMKTSKCNLRKSLAWDSAFFTSAGVLDAEELTSIIEGVEKHELPDIQEDVYKSCESISTLASDSLTFESVEMEGDLFEDVRASIQKSSKKSSPAVTNTKVPSSSAVLTGFQTHGTSKKVGTVSRNKMKAPLPSKNSSAGMQGYGKMTKKDNTIFPQLPQKPAATRRESSILKPSRVLGKCSSSSTISSKRESLGNLHLKNERDKAKRIVGERISSMTKASVIGDSRRIVPKPTVPSKSPSGLPVSSKTKSMTSTSSGNNLSENIGKSSLSYLRRSYKPTSSCPAVKTPSKSKAEPGVSGLLSLLSAAKLSPSISPASSISDWSSSESSSSTLMAKPVCNSSRSSLDSGSSRKVSLDTDADQGTNSCIPQSDSHLERQEAQHIGITSQKERTTPGATVPPTHKKPSGLRLPSPKIGFFDGVKPLVRTPRGGLQTRSLVPGGLPRHGGVQNVKSSSDIPMGAVENASLFHVVEKACHDFLPHKGDNNLENAHHDDQIDCLSEQVGHMDLNFETQKKLNGDSHSFWPTDISTLDKSNVLELACHEEIIDCPKKRELLKGSSTTCLSLSPTGFDVASSIRTPFTVKDSFCNMDNVVFTESTISEEKSAILPVPESIIMKEN